MDHSTEHVAPNLDKEAKKDFKPQKDLTDKSNMSSESAQAVYQKVMSYWVEAKTLCSEARYQMAKDEDFYDGIQWEAEDVLVLEERGQAPLVFNVIAQHVNYLLGVERQTRVESHVYPRRKEDNETAVQKQNLLKYLSDVNKLPLHVSTAFKDAVVVGLGWLEDGIRSDPDEEPLFSRRESWRNVWWDMLAKEPDMSDSRYMVRSKYVDLDTSIAMFPGQADTLRLAAKAVDQYSDIDNEDTEHKPADSRGFRAGIVATDSFHIGLQRQRVRLIECWYRQPTTIKRLACSLNSQLPEEIIKELSDLNGKEHDPENEDHKFWVGCGLASIVEAVKMEMRCSVFCTKGLLQDMTSAYKHNKYPFTPIKAYTRGRDNTPYGPSRAARDPQEDLNKRRSKALYILSTKQIIADDDAVEDWDELEEQAALPNGIIKKKRGSDLEIRDDVKLAQEQVALIESDSDFIERAIGVTAEQLGRDSKALSGVAIERRQSQGSLATAPLFDNLRFALQTQGEKQLSMIEQFYDTPKIVRIVGESGVPEMQNLNWPEYKKDGRVNVMNPITETKADFVINTQDYRESVRQAQMEALFELVSKLDSEVVINLLDLVVESSDIQNRDEIVKRIRMLNGQQSSEDVDNEQHDQELQQRRDEQQKAEKHLESLDVKERELDIAQKEQTVSGAKLGNLNTSATLAQLMGQFPQLAELVDQLYEAASIEQQPTL